MALSPVEKKLVEIALIEAVANRKKIEPKKKVLPKIIEKDDTNNYVKKVMDVLKKLGLSL